MALVYTPSLKPQFKLPKFSLPKFSLPSVEGQIMTQNDFKKKVNVFLFICNHCPYVKAIEDRIINLARSCKDKDVSFVAICSNDGETYPEDSFESIKSNWIKKNFKFPYLYDESQSAAKAFEAICTPDIFVFDENSKLFYRGRFDDNWKDSTKVERQDLKLVIEKLLLNEALDFEPVSSMGCSIKWK